MFALPKPAWEEVRAWLCDNFPDVRNVSVDDLKAWQRPGSIRDRDGPMKKIAGIILRAVVPCSKLGDRLYATLNFVANQGRFPHRKSALMNDVLFKLKTTSEICDPLRVFVTDKEFVKVFVRAKLGDKYNVPTLWIARTYAEARAAFLPERCVIKPTHLSGEIILRKDGEEVDWEMIRHWFQSNHYLLTREPNYRHLVSKVIVEPFAFDNDEIEDYKVFCFDGEPGFVQVDFDRFSDHTRVYVDTKGHELPFSIKFPKGALKKVPENLQEIIRLARVLSEDFRGFVRIDFYSDGRNCLIGEITNCHGGAGQKFIPRESEKFASELLFRAAVHKESFSSARQ